MSHHNTVFSQLLKLVPRHEFETLAKEHHEGRKLRKMTRWTQFVAMSMAQLTGRVSLRDIVDSLSAQASKLYHLGIGTVSRSSLARVNENQPCELYEALFGKLLARCQTLAPRHGFRFRNKLYSLDSTTVDLCLELFPWARFRATKGAVKLHVGLDHSGHLPAFVQVTDGRTHDMTVARALQFPASSIIVSDRAYTDYGWLKSLNDKGIFLVTRQKRNARYQVDARHAVPERSGITSDQTIHLTGKRAAEVCPIPLRRVGYRDPGTGKHYVFLTNNFELAATTIAGIYKARWDIELFFKWIKQHLKVKTFVGTSRNAVLTQLWIAVCMYLLLAFIKFCSKVQPSLGKIARLLQLNLFERRGLKDLLEGRPPDPPRPELQFQMRLA